MTAIDYSGFLVRMLIDTREHAGLHTILAVPNGKAIGAYLHQLRTGRARHTGRMLDACGRDPFELQNVST